MGRRRGDRPVAPTPSRRQEAFWDFIHDESNADLLRLPETTAY